MTWIKELRGHSNRMLAKRDACWTTSPSGPSRSSLVLHWSSLLWIPGSDWKVSRHEPLATGARLIYPRKDQQIGAGHGCPGFFAKAHCASIYFPLSTTPTTKRCLAQNLMRINSYCNVSHLFPLFTEGYHPKQSHKYPILKNSERHNKTFLTDMKRHPQENNALMSHYEFYQFKHLILIIFYFLIYL